MLKEIPKEVTFTIRLFVPQKAGFGRKISGYFAQNGK